MEFGTYCAINSMFGIKNIPQDYMASTKRIHQNFHPKYLPPINIVKLFRSISLSIHKQPPIYPVPPSERNNSLLLTLTEYQMVNIKSK